MKPGDRLVCAFVEPQQVGKQFTKWLLHVTIVPWFRLTDPSDSIVHGLELALRTGAPFEAVADEQALFGPKHNRHAVLIAQPTPFVQLEKQVRSYLHKKRAWLVDETTKAKRQFRPHVTQQGAETLREGDTFPCDRLYIVEQKGNYKEIVGKVQLTP